MEHEVLLKDVLPYIWVWTLAIVAVLSVLAYRLWRFGKKYPEIFKPDTTAEDRQSRLQKAELRRQYNNQSIASLAFIFVWPVGMVVICFGSAGSTLGSALTIQGWFMIVFAICIILWVLSMVQRKPKG